MKIASNQVWIDEKLQPATLTLENGKIEKIEPGIVQEDGVINYQDHYILPGFINIHTHGWKNCDANHPNKETMEIWKKHLPDEGVTSFLATTSTQPYQDNIQALEFFHTFLDEQKEGDGARILGVYMEGNFISTARRGAQNIHAIAPLDGNVLQDYQQASGNHLLLVCIAPEEKGSDAFIQKAQELGIRISLGHSAADYETAMHAYELGAISTTHLGNGMNPFHHRNPGLFGAALCKEDVYAELIGDGVHVAFPSAHIIGTMKGKEHLILVTDTGKEKDSDQYKSMQRGGAIRLEDGTLHGSILDVNRGVYNLIHYANLPFETVIRAATINPATMLGLENKKGSIEEGKDADLVVCTQDFDIVQTYCMGIAQK